MDPEGLNANVFAFNGRHLDSLKCAQEFCEGQNLHPLSRLLKAKFYFINYRPKVHEVTIKQKKPSFKDLFCLASEDPQFMRIPPFESIILLPPLMSIAGIHSKFRHQKWLICVQTGSNIIH